MMHQSRGGEVNCRCLKLAMEAFSTRLTSDVIRYVAIAVLAANIGASSTHMFRILIVRLIECRAP